MANWKENDIKLSFSKNHAEISWSREGNTPIVTMHRLPFDQPGEQTETESQDAVRAAAKKALQELIAQL